MSHRSHTPRFFTLDDDDDDDDDGTLTFSMLTLDVISSLTVVF